MSSDQNLYRLEQENSLMFGLKWSFVGFAIALCFLAGCSQIFDSGPQRYNTVEGPRRPPPLNMQTGAGGQPQMQQQMLYPHMAQQPQMQQAMAAPQMQQGMMAQQPGMQPGMMHQQQVPHATPYGEDLESDSWFGGLFNWFGDDDEPAPMRMGARPVSAMPPQQATPYDMYHQPQAQAQQPQPAYQSYPPTPMPQPMQSVAPQQAYMQQPVPQPVPQAAPMHQPMPTAAPTLSSRQPQPAPYPSIAQPAPQPMQAQPSASSNMHASIEAQIAELERELAMSEARRHQLQQEPQDDSWLPNLGLDNMFSDDPAPMPASPQPYGYGGQPMPMPSAQGYKVVKLPPPPPRGTAPAPIPSMQPSAAMMASAPPMPPVISEPMRDPMASAPVMSAHQSSIDVPLAPNISARSTPSNVPVGLIPPETTGASEGNYLGESRYSSRRAHQGFSRY